MYTLKWLGAPGYADGPVVELSTDELRLIIRALEDAQGEYSVLVEKLKDIG